jgi:hypothetical protein
VDSCDRTRAKRLDDVPQNSLSRDFPIQYGPIDESCTVIVMQNSPLFFQIAQLCPNSRRRLSAVYSAAQRLRRARAVAIKRVEKLSLSGREDFQLMVNQVSGRC